MADLGDSANWPPGLEQTLNSLRQGSVIEGLHFAFSHAEGNLLWAGPRQVLSSEDSQINIAAVSIPEISKGLVISQACDIMRKDHPWLVTVPVYDLSQVLTADEFNRRRNNLPRHLIRLTGNWTSSGFWVADLRLEFSLEKTLISGKVTREPFSTENEYHVLSESLGARLLRPALENTILDVFVEPFFGRLDQLFEQSPHVPRPEIDQNRIQSSFDYETQVFTIRAYIMPSDTLSEEQKLLYQEAINGIRIDCERSSIEILGIEFKNSREMTADEYQRSSRMSPESA